MIEKIKQLQLIRYGEPSEAVELIDSPLNILGHDEVLVSLEASPIHISDFLMIAGRYGIKPTFPASLGAEGVGIVTKIGPRVDHNLLNKRVVILPTYDYGTWAEKVVVPANSIVSVNSEAEALQLAQLTINAVTAYLALRDYARLMPGEWIGQTAANSAVGQYVISLAQMAGIKTLNVVRSADSVDLVKSAGGDLVVQSDENLENNIREILNGRQLSLVLDTVGGTTVGVLAKFLKNHATIVGYSSESGQSPVIAPLDLFYRRLNYSGFWVIDWFRTTPKSEIDRVISHLSDLIAEGKLMAKIGGTYNLDAYKDAFQAAQQLGRRGKFFFTFNKP